jgi:hypothetical protein
MPRKSYRKRSASKRKSQSQSQSQHQNQSGGAGEQSQQQTHEISQATLNQAAEIAQKVMGSMMQSNGVKQVGGSGHVAADAPPAVAPGLQTAMAGGAVAGAVAGAETFSSLKGSPIMGGGRRGRRGRGRKSQSQSSQSQSQSSQSQSQKGGMVPGLLTAVETALVPLGLYLGQKALQSRRSSGSRSLGKSFDFRRASRRTRRRR